MAGSGEEDDELDFLEFRVGNNGENHSSVVARHFTERDDVTGDDLAEPVTTEEPQTDAAIRSTEAPGGQEDHFEKKERLVSHYHQNSLGEVEPDDDTGKESDEGEWEPMPTVGSHEVYDDKNNLLQELMSFEGSNSDLPAKGYTRVANNDEVASVNSLDDKTDFLFENQDPEDIETRTQIQTTKSMLTPAQRIAYVGLCRVVMNEMAEALRKYEATSVALESLQVWGSKLCLRLYDHMELNNEEQLMIEQLPSHGVEPRDLSPALMTAQTVNSHHSIKEHSLEDSNLKASELHVGGDTVPETVDIDVHWTIMCDLFLILLSEGNYDSRSRTLLELVGSEFDITAADVSQFERKATDAMQLDEAAVQDWTEHDIIEARRVAARRRRYAYIGLATIGGGLVIGLTSGFLAPFVGGGIAAGLGTIGITGTSGFLAGTGGAALITTTGTAIGAGVGNRSMNRRMGHVRTFEFRPVFNMNRLNVVISVSGWMTGKDDDVRLPFSTIDPLMGDVLSVLWEPEMMRSLGQTINILATEALATGVQQILGATILTTLMASLTLPLWLSKLSYLVDNPWSVSLDRAWSAGKILADVIRQRNLGGRPVTLVGFSLGARVIYSCLHELSRKRAYGLVQDVFLFGAPVFYSKKKFANVRSVVSGRFVNGYSNKDWILAFLFPASRSYGSILGLNGVPDEQFMVENMDVTADVDGHMSYRNKMPLLLKKCGWSVMSEEFTEIEDPDPDKLREKQRRLLSELREADTDKKRGVFGGWTPSWLKTAGKRNSEAGVESREEVPQEDEYNEPLFDLDAIRSEFQNIKLKKPEMLFDADEVSREIAPPPPYSASQDLPPELAADLEPPSMPLTREQEPNLHEPILEAPKLQRTSQKRVTLPATSSVTMSFEENE